MKKLSIYLLILFLLPYKAFTISLYLYPTNHIQKKGETIGMVIEETEEWNVLSISLEDKFEYPFYKINTNLVYSLVGIPYSIVTNFSLIVKITNKISGEMLNFELPFYVNIDPLTYAKRKPKKITNFEITNDFSFKTNKFKTPDNYEGKISTFSKPLEGTIKDGYGVNRSRGGILYGRIHLGIDIPREWGTKVHPTSDGIVTVASRDKVAGNYVVIYHGYGVSSVYMHLSKIIAKKGQIVTTNDIIGLVGSTGRSTGSHLHLGISINNVYVDPLSFLERDYSSSNIISNGIQIKIDTPNNSNLSSQF